MKNIWLILFLILTCEVAFCQTIVPRANSSITVQDARFSAQYNLFVPRYADTTAANLSTNEGIDTLGAIIFTYDNMSLMVRKYDSGKKWSAIGGGGGAGTVTSVGITGSDFSISGSPVTTSGNISLTLATVNGNVGSFGSATQTGTFTVNGKGLITAASNTTITPAVGSITGLGTGVATALGVNIGTAGSFVVNGGALGTPASGTLTNASGLPIVGGTTGTLTIARGGTNLTTLGTDGQLLRVNTGATALEYFTPTYVSANIYTSNGTLTGDREVDLGTFNLQVNDGGGLPFFQINPFPNSESALLRAVNTTNDDNLAYFVAATTDIGSNSQIQADFNGGVEAGSIIVAAGASNSTITSNADSIRFVHNLFVEVADSADYYMMVIDKTTGTTGKAWWPAGGGGTTIYTGDGSLAGNRTIDLNGNYLRVEENSNAWFQIDPANGAAFFHGFDPTDNGNAVTYQITAEPTTARFDIEADFNDGVKFTSIVGLSDATTSSITSTADSHTFVAGGENNGVISLSSSYIRAFDATDDGNQGQVNASAGATEAAAFILAGFNDGVKEARVTAFADASSSSITSTADSHTFIAGGENNLLVELEQSFIRAFNAQDNDNVALLRGEANTTEAQFTLLSSFNDGVKLATVVGFADASSSSITHTADLHTITGAVSIVGVTTLTGNLLAVADNTYDIGDATNSFQDIFSRTLVLDGSTSGTVTLASDAVAKSFRATTLTGEGYVSTNSITIQQSTEALADDNSTQPVFASGQDVITVQGSTLYEIEAFYDISSGSTSHSIASALVLGGGASINWVKYTVNTYVAAINTNVNTIRFVTIDQVASTVTNAAGAFARQYMVIKGFISINAAGTVTPSIAFSTTTSGTTETNIGSYFKLTPVGVNSTASVGPIN